MKKLILKLAHWIINKYEIPAQKIGSTITVCGGTFTITEGTIALPLDGPATLTIKGVEKLIGGNRL